MNLKGTDFGISVLHKSFEIVWFGTLALAYHKEAYNLVACGDLTLLCGFCLTLLPFELFDF